MTFYAMQMTPQARAAAMVAIVSELERVREGKPTDDIGRRVRTQALSDLQAALDSLRAAEPVEPDRMPQDAVERTVGRVHDAYARFCHGLRCPTRTGGSVMSKHFDDFEPTVVYMPDETLGQTAEAMVEAVGLDIDHVARVLNAPVDDIRQGLLSDAARRALVVLVMDAARNGDE